MENKEMTVVPAEQMQIPIGKAEALALYSSASTLQLTAEESTAMMKQFDDEEIEIRPDGHIYLPQSYYRNRLNETVGIGQWGLVTKGTTQMVTPGKAPGAPDKIKLLFNGILVIRKCFVAEAVGEAELHDNNDNQSLATVWESAKSDCITRCCKDLSIAKQIYQPTYVREWQNKYAIQVWADQKKRWRKKTAAPLRGETGPVIEGQPGPAGSSNDSSLPWLNKFGRGADSTKITKDWSDVSEALKKGTMSMTDVTDQWRINSKDIKELQAIKSTAKPAAAEQKKDEPKKVVIPGDVWAKLEKCKWWEDVDTLARDYELEIKGNAEWRAAFMDTKKQLKAKPKS